MCLVFIQVCITEFVNKSRLISINSAPTHAGKTGSTTSCSLATRRETECCFKLSKWFFLSSRRGNPGALFVNQEVLEHKRRKYSFLLRYGSKISTVPAAHFATLQSWLLNLNKTVITNNAFRWIKTCWEGCKAFTQKSVSICLPVIHAVHTESRWNTHKGLPVKQLKIKWVLADNMCLYLTILADKNAINWYNHNLLLKTNIRLKLILKSP